MVGGTNLRPTMQTSVHFDNFAELYKVLCSVVSMSFLTGTCPSSETQGQRVGDEGKSKKAEWRRLFGTGLVRHCPHGLFSPFFTFLRAIFFRPFRLSLAPTICPWVSEDGTCQELKTPSKGLLPLMCIVAVYEQTSVVGIIRIKIGHSIQECRPSVAAAFTEILDVMILETEWCKWMNNINNYSHYEIGESLLTSLSTFFFIAYDLTH